MRVGARKGFAYHSVDLVSLANGNKFEADSNALFLSGSAFYPFKILPCPNSDLFWDTFVSVVYGLDCSSKREALVASHVTQNNFIFPHVLEGKEVSWCSQAYPVEVDNFAWKFLVFHESIQLLSEEL